jgi:hypothetical protein
VAIYSVVFVVVGGGGGGGGGTSSSRSSKLTSRYDNSGKLYMDFMEKRLTGRMGKSS